MNSDSGLKRLNKLFCNVNSQLKTHSYARLENLSSGVSLAPLNRKPSPQDIDQAIRDAVFAVDSLDCLQPGDTVLNYSGN